MAQRAGDRIYKSGRLGRGLYGDSAYRSMDETMKDYENQKDLQGVRGMLKEHAHMKNLDDYSRDVRKADPRKRPHRKSSGKK